jgi:hypothetical protein
MVLIPWAHGEEVTACLEKWSPHSVIVQMRKYIYLRMCTKFVPRKSLAFTVRPLYRPLFRRIISGASMPNWAAITATVSSSLHAYSFPCFCVRSSSSCWCSFSFAESRRQVKHGHVRRVLQSAMPSRHAAPSRSGSAWFYGNSEYAHVLSHTLGGAIKNS